MFELVNVELHSSVKCTSDDLLLGMVPYFNWSFKTKASCGHEKKFLPLLGGVFTKDQQAGLKSR